MLAICALLSSSCVDVVVVVVVDGVAVGVCDGCDCCVAGETSSVFRLILFRSLMASSTVTSRT